MALTKERFATLNSAYAPTLAAEHNIKEESYRALDSIISETQNSDKPILKRDFNTRVGTDHLVREKVIGPHGVGKIKNNGVRLLSFCAEHHLVITNTIFQMKNRVKTTWQHPRLKHWNLLDNVVVRKRDRQDVLSTRAMRGAECWTDHLMVRSKLRMSIHPCRFRTASHRPLQKT